MASCHGNTQSEPAKIEQIITEFFAKSLHIVLESRCPYVSSRNYSGEQVMSSPSSSSSSSSSIRPRDKWFNLALRECPAALENIDFWRQSSIEPMVVDVILVQRLSHWDPLSCSPKRGLIRNLSGKEQGLKHWNAENDEIREKIIERWVLKYETRKGGRECSSGSKRSSTISSHTLYKKSILILRSLYAMVRLLPAYKLFRDLNSSCQIPSFNLAHRVSSFVEPFTRREESEMQHFAFTPVETFCGRLSLSVSYNSSISDVGSESSTPMTPRFIADYVGSPLADPLKRLPSTSPFERRHSWSYDLSRASPPSAFPSPSPTYSDSRASIYKSISNRLPPTSSPHHKNNTNLDEYWPSPIFSPSPSPSPPACLSGSNICKAFLRSESAPVSISQSKLSNAPSMNIKQNLPHSPPLKGTRSIVSRTERNSGLVQTSSAADKLFSVGKIETERHTGVKVSSSNSPQKSFSRSSSRLSFQYDFDDIEFCGPFVVEDDGMTNPSSRSDSFDQKGSRCEPLDPEELLQAKRSKNADVGALVHMLKKAPPLGQAISNSRDLTEASSHVNEISQMHGAQGTTSLTLVSTGLVLPKTTADALEELREYREIKDSLLMQGASFKS